MKNIVSGVPRIVLGTFNRGKASEFVHLLAALPLEVVALADLSEAIRIDETANSLAANADLKATRQAAHLGHWVLADDTALAVDALAGAPGIFSARFAGPQCNDSDNRTKLLAELSGVSIENRAASFICNLTLADPSGIVRARSKGVCRGRILTATTGTGGFGYDSLFELVEYRRTLAEMGPAATAVLSHRARAVEAIRPALAEQFFPDR